MWPFRTKPKPSLSFRVAQVDRLEATPGGPPAEHRLHLQPINPPGEPFFVTGGFRLDIIAAEHPGRTVAEGDVLTLNLNLKD